MTTAKRIDKSNWCRGCGNQMALNVIKEVLENSGLCPKQDIVLVTDIGCSGRTGFKPEVADYLKIVHSLHGRSVDVAFGGKIANPDKFTVVVVGDGGVSAIGLADFLEVCRMNPSILVIIIDNNNFGMTGGQQSPMTPLGMKTTTFPYGGMGTPVDICKLVKDAGASFVARSTTYHLFGLNNILKEAVDHVVNMKGTAVVDIKTQCPTRFGKNNNLSAAQMLLNFKEQAVVGGNLEEACPEGKFPIGIFVKKENLTDFTKQQKRLIARCVVEEHQKKPAEAKPISISEFTENGLPEMKTLKILFIGEAGQGIAKMADVLAEAAIAKDKRMHAATHATHEATVRGGPSSSSVVIHNEQIKSRTVQIENADIVVVMKEGFHDLSSIKKSAIVIDGEIFSKLVNSKSANMAALGFLSQNEKLKYVVDIPSLQKGILAVFGERFKESNFKALEVGKNYLVS